MHALKSEQSVHCTLFPWPTPFCQHINEYASAHMHKHSHCSIQTDNKKLRNSFKIQNGPKRDLEVKQSKMSHFVHKLCRFMRFLTQVKWIQNNSYGVPSFGMNNWDEMNKSQSSRIPIKELKKENICSSLYAMQTMYATLSGVLLE